MERDNIFEFQYHEPHPIFLVRQDTEVWLFAQLRAEQEARIAAERRAVLTAGERRELTKVRELRHDLDSWRFLWLYTFLVLVLVVAAMKGWI